MTVTDQQFDLLCRMAEGNEAGGTTDLRTEERDAIAAILAQEQEYRQVAGILALDIDILEEVATDERMTAQDFRNQIRHHREKKDEVISNPRSRDTRYGAACMLFAIASQGGTDETK